MEGNGFVSIDENTVSAKSLDKEMAQNNFVALQKQIFQFGNMNKRDAEFKPATMIQPGTPSDNIEDDELFGNGIPSDDQVVPCTDNCNKVADVDQVISPTALAKREKFRSEKYQEFDEVDDNLDNNDVFYDDISYRNNSLQNKNSSDNSIANRRSKSLPDLVPEGMDNDDGICDEFMDKGSPDVVKRNISSRRHFSKTCIMDDDNSVITSEVHFNKKPKIRRSVSFQEKPAIKSISPSAAQKRHSYRKSSGYGTGDSKTSSLQSTISNVSGLSREDSKDGASIPQGGDTIDGDFRQQDKMSVISSQNAGIQHDSFEEKISNSAGEQTGGQIKPDADLPMLSIFQTNSESNVSQQHLSVNPDNFDNLPNLDKLLDSSNVQKHEKPLLSLSLSPSFQFVIDRYCRNSSSASSLPSERSPGLQRQAEGNSHCGCVNSNQVTDILKSLSSMLTQTDDKDLQRVVLEQFVSKIQTLSNEEISQKGPSLNSDSSSASTPSPSEYRNNLDTAKNPAAGYHEPKVQTKLKQDHHHNQTEDIMPENVELMSRCRDHNCNNKTCNKVRMCIRGLETALEQSWSPDIPLIKTVCGCLWKHATDCDDPEFTCNVAWCYHLKQYMKEMNLKLTYQKGSGDSIGLDDMRSVDDRTADDVFTILSRIYRTPVLTCSVIPPESPNRFSKFVNKDECEDRSDIELITSYGHFRNVFLAVQSNNHQRQCVLKKIKIEGDDATAIVYLRLVHKKHRNIVQHYWLAEYSSIYHVCSEFLKGGTLQECLEIATITPQRAVMYMIQILDAVLYLHKLNIIYLYWSCCNMLFVDTSRRHIKLSNLSLSVMEGVKLFDVGLTKLSLPPCIVPPELTGNEEDISLRSSTDSWGAGCLISEMLTGKQPWYNYRHRRKEELWKKMKSGEELPLNQKQMDSLTGYQELLQSCWKKNPIERISLEEMKQYLLPQIQE